VIVDAVFSTAEERRDIEAAAQSAEASFAGLWLNADEATMVARVEGRRGDASDATAEVVRDQIARGTGPVGWHCIDAGGRPDDTLAAARRVVDRALAKSA
jgi:predicted kinase